MSLAETRNYRTINTIVVEVLVLVLIFVFSGVELVELLLDPEDWFPSEPYKMVFSRKKNPKWKNFPYRCEHCFKVKFTKW